MSTCQKCISDVLLTGHVMERPNKPMFTVLYNNETEYTAYTCDFVTHHCDRCVYHIIVMYYCTNSFQSKADVKIPRCLGSLTWKLILLKCTKSRPASNNKISILINGSKCDAQIMIDRYSINETVVCAYSSLSEHKYPYKVIHRCV